MSGEQITPEEFWSVEGEELAPKERAELGAANWRLQQSLAAEALAEHLYANRSHAEQEAEAGGW